MSKSYIEWMATETPSRWSVDMANVEVNEKAVKMGFDTSAGNPRLTWMRIMEKYDSYKDDIAAIQSLKGDEKAYEMYRRFILPCAKVLEPIYEKSGGTRGLQCVMVNPAIGHDVDKMVEAAKLISSWAPNITVKLPTTGAGITAAEECWANGIHVTGTVGFSVAQALLLAEAHARGIKRAKAAGKPVRGGNFALFTLRCDSVIAEAAKDNGLAYIGPEECQWVGIAIAKRIYKVFMDKGYTEQNDFWLVPAGVGTKFSMTQFTGGKVLLDLYMPQIDALNEACKDDERAYHIDDPVDPVALERLLGCKLFRQMYEYDGLAKEDLISFGAIQNINTNFGEAGFQRLIAL